jgi:hypothetical protein
MNKYLNWIIQQDLEFQKEVLKHFEPNSKFKDHNFKPVTLDELEQLDDKYINGDTE